MIDIPEMPKPVKQHEWLQRLVGEWETEAEVTMDPAEPPVRSKGMQVDRAIGGFWVLGECDGLCPADGAPFKGVITLGYDPENNQYIGTWIDSMTSYLWNYVGAVDATGDILTMETEGPCPMTPGEFSKFREVIEFKSPDHRIYTSSIQGDDGEWTTMLTVNYHRKK